MNDLTIADINAFYDKKITQLIVDKYGMPPIKALELYLNSETYRMFTDPQLKMTDFAPHALFDMWESEQITGDPRNSIYIRGE